MVLSYDNAGYEIRSYRCVECQTGDNSRPEGGSCIRPVLNKLDEGIGGKYSTHASFPRPDWHRAVSEEIRNAPVTAKHNFGFPRTTAISIRDFLLNDELR